MEKDIGKINKGEYQGTVTDIVIGVREYNGRVGVDIREFVASEKYTGPTKKGLRIPAESFKAFKDMINTITDEDLKEAEKEEAPKEDASPKESGEGKEDMPDY
jgi:sporulation protein YlmC with PRC-barrel domain